MKVKIAIIGNCQARPVAHLLQNAFHDVEVNVIAIVHLLKNEQINEYMPLFEEADFIVTQDIADNYPCEFVRTNFLSDLFGSKLIKIPNLFYRGYTPELIYLRLKGHGTLKGPLSDYHHQIIFDSWKEGASLAQTFSNVNNLELWEKMFAKVHLNSLNELKEREKSLDIGMSDQIDQFLSKERLFYTFNHPSKKMLYILVDKIASLIELKKNIDFNPDNMREPLNQFIVPISEYVTGSLSLKFNQQNILFKGVCANESGVFNISCDYELDELIHEFFKIYDKNVEIIKVKKGHP